jgi:hypothetical protein
MVNEKSLANLKPYSATHKPPANNGRKPSQLKKFIKDNNVNREDVALMIKNVLFSKSYDQLVDILQDNKQPMIIRLFIKSYLNDFKKGSLINLQYLLDRAFGNPKQEIEVSGNISVDQMSYEEREAKIREYIEGHMQRGADATAGQDRGVPGQPEEAVKKES